MRVSYLYTFILLLAVAQAAPLLLTRGEGNLEPAHQFPYKALLQRHVAKRSWSQALWIRLGLLKAPPKKPTYEDSRAFSLRGPGAKTISEPPTKRYIKQRDNWVYELLVKLGLIKKPDPPRTNGGEIRKVTQIDRPEVTKRESSPFIRAALNFPDVPRPDVEGKPDGPIARLLASLGGRLEIGERDVKPSLVRRRWLPISNRPDVDTGMLRKIRMDIRVGPIKGNRGGKLARRGIQKRFVLSPEFWEWLFRKVRLEGPKVQEEPKQSVDY